MKLSFARMLKGQARTSPTEDSRYSRTAGFTLMELLIVMSIILILMLIGAFPSWPYSSGWGYGPSGLLGVVVVVLLILVLMGRI